MEVDTKIIVAVIAAVSALISAYVVNTLSRKKDKQKTNIDIAREYASLKNKSPEDAVALANTLGPGILVYRKGKEKTIIDLPPSGTLIIGRSKQADIYISDPLLSNQSAMISVKEGRVMIQSLVSANVFKVNGKPEGKKTLFADDCIEIGSTIIYFRGK